MSIAAEIYEAADDLTISELVERLDAANLTWREVCAGVGRDGYGTLPEEEICRRCGQVAPCIDCEERFDGRHGR